MHFVFNMGYYVSGVLKQTSWKHDLLIYSSRFLCSNNLKYTYTAYEKIAIFLQFFFFTNLLRLNSVHVGERDLVDNVLWYASLVTLCTNPTIRLWFQIKFISYIMCINLLIYHVCLKPLKPIQLILENLSINKILISSILGVHCERNIVRGINMLFCILNLKK